MTNYDFEKIQRRKRYVEEVREQQKSFGRILMGVFLGSLLVGLVVLAGGLLG